MSDAQPCVEDGSNIALFTLFVYIVNYNEGIGISIDGPPCVEAGSDGDNRNMESVESSTCC